jgi:hypothetical protein
VGVASSAMAWKALPASRPMTTMRTIRFDMIPLPQDGASNGPSVKIT